MTETMCKICAATSACRSHVDLVEALQEIQRNCEPWRKADNMAGRLYDIAQAAIARAGGIPCQS